MASAVERSLRSGFVGGDADEREGDGEGEGEGMGTGRDEVDAEAARRCGHPIKTSKI